MKNHVQSVIVCRTPSALDGREVVLVASIGGNSKTKGTLELSVFPAEVVDQWEALITGVPKVKHGAIYVWALRDSKLLNSVCPESCVYVRTGKGCYIQHNPQNASQAARILREIGPGSLSELLTVCKFTGISQVRSMVVGDAAAIPPAEWESVEKQITRLLPIKAWLAYTHAWRGAPHLKASHVASCDDESQARDALNNGWSVFQVGAPTAAAMPRGSALCPSTREFGNHRGYKIGCVGCPMKCNGATPLYRYVPRHSSGDASKKAASHRRGFNVLSDSKGRTRGLYVA